MYDEAALKKLKESIAEHLRKEGKAIPTEDALHDYALSLLEFFNLLLEGDEHLDVESESEIR